MFGTKVNRDLAIIVVGLLVLLNTVGSAQAAQDSSDCMTFALENSEGLASAVLEDVLKEDPVSAARLTASQVGELQRFAYKTALTNLYNGCMKK